jgi:hypothetical protein
LPLVGCGMAVRLVPIIAGFVTACLAGPSCGRTPGVPFHGDGAADGNPGQGTGEAGSASGARGGNGGATDLGGASGGNGCGWDGLPACVYVDSCYRPGSPYWECTRTGDCAFTFSEQFGGLPLSILVECAELPIWPSTDGGASWTLSDDSKTIFLAGSACDLVRASSTPRVFVQSIHSCVL